MASFLGQPVLDPQTRHAAELPQIVGRERNIERNGMRRDQHIVGPDQGAASLECRPQFSIHVRCSAIEGCDNKRFQGALDHASIPFRRVELSSDCQFSSGDRGDRDVFDGKREKPASGALRPMGKDVRHDIRVEHHFHFERALLRRGGDTIPIDLRTCCSLG